MLALLALLIAAQEPPVVRSEGPVSRTLTVYRDDLAFVTETHVVSLPEGRAAVVFGGVSDRIVPETAALFGFAGTSVERNFTANLLTKRSLFEALVGQTASLRRTDPATGRSEVVPVRVLAAERGVIVRTPDGTETLDCTGLGQSLIAGDRPTGLTARPELSVTVDSETEGEASLTIAYLARDLGWAADYVLTVGEGTARLRGWLTIRNGTATRFDAAPAAIVAGTLNISDDTRPPVRRTPPYRAVCWPQQRTAGPFRARRARNPYLLGFPGTARRAFGLATAPAPETAEEFEADEIVVTGVRTATEERFGDYRLYRPPGPVSLAPYQTKQIAFLDEDAVAFDRRYEMALPTRPDPDAPIAAGVVYAIDNEADGSLARALPAGTARVQTVSDGTLFYLGKDRIGDLAVGRPAEVEAGRTLSVRAYARVETREDARRGDRLPREATHRVTVDMRNDTQGPATVEVTLDDWRAAYTLVDLLAVTGGQAVDGAVRLVVPSGAERRVTLVLAARDAD